MMNEKSLVYDRTEESLRQVYELRDSGVRFLCPVCRADLIVALDFESALEHGVHPGIYCSSHPEHLSELIELRPRSKII